MTVSPKITLGDEFNQVNVIHLIYVKKSDWCQIDCFCSMSHFDWLFKLIIGSLRIQNVPWSDEKIHYSCSLINEL